MNTYQYNQFEKEQRRRCREAREEWEKLYEPVYRSDLDMLERSSIIPLTARVDNLEEQIFLSSYGKFPNTKLRDTIQQQNAKINYLENKVNNLSSSKKRKYTKYE